MINKQSTSDNDKRYVLNAFYTKFRRLSDKKIAIYGTGNNTRYILEIFKWPNIVGLMDYAKIGDELCGHKVISEAEALALGVDTVVIVAIPRNVKLIYRRICDFTTRHNIAVFDVAGNLLDSGKENLDGEYGKIADNSFLEISNTVQRVSYADRLLKFADTPENKMVVDEFISRELSDSIILDATNGKLLIKSVYDMAYSYFAPIILKFFSFIIETAKELKLDYILYAARDGFILEEIHKLYETTYSGCMDIKHCYFYASRAVCTLASVQNEQELADLIGLIDYQGTAKECLRDVFLLTADQIMEQVTEADEEYLLKHKGIILARAQKLRENYLAYIASLGIPEKSRVGFVDFFSSGTSQRGLAKISDLNLLGLYLGKYGFNEERDVVIHSIFTQETWYEPASYLLSDHYFMENILVSNEATLIDFTDMGKPVFKGEDRMQEDFEDLQTAHNALLDYAWKMMPNIDAFIRVNEHLTDYFINLLDDEHSIKETDYLSRISLLKDDWRSIIQESAISGR